MVTILHSLWYKTTRGETIGVIAIKSKKKTWVVNIGLATGFKKEVDEQLIGKYGAKISYEVACAYFPSLANKKYDF